MFTHEIRFAQVYKFEAYACENLNTRLGKIACEVKCVSLKYAQNEIKC